MSELADLADTNDGRGIIYGLTDLVDQLTLANVIAALPHLDANGHRDARQFVRNRVRAILPKEVWP
jgi:hypothetical protein